MNPVEILQESRTIDSVLEDLGLSRELLEEAVKEGERARKTVTDDHPPNSGGTYAHHETVRSLRSQLRPKGWEISNTDNLAGAIHPEGVLAVVVTGGSKETGNPDVAPTSRNPKGAKTAQFVGENQQQLELIPIPEELKTARTLPSQTWVLLYYSDRKNEEVRFELSLPTEIDDRDRLSAWDKRILLGSFASSWQERHPPLADDEVEFSDEIDFDI